MRWTVVVPGALLPSALAADVLAGAQAPWLMQALSRASVEPAAGIEPPGAAHLSWLWRRFGGSGEPVTAPYALRALDADADCGAQCWHIDPVHFAFARDHLLVAPLDELPSVPEEALLARHLQEALAEVAPEAQARLIAHHGRWLLTLARPWSMRATPLDGAYGQSAHEHWPAGPDAAAWRRLLTEVQMRWHAEPLNDARDERGQRSVNALWLHGGGPWAPLPEQPFAAVASNDAVLRGWALASGLPPQAVHDDEPAGLVRGDVVSIRRDLLLPAQFEAWGQWLDRLVQLESGLRELHAASVAAGCDELALVLCGRRQVRTARLRRGDAWRVWRRAPVGPVFAEAR